MSIIEKYYGTIEKSELVFEPNEVASRLKTQRGYTNETIEKCKQLLLDNIDCKYCAVLSEVKISGNNIDFGSFSAESFDLARNMHNADRCFVFCVTLGLNVDYLLKRLSVTSMSEHFIADALSSALVENATDKAEEIIKGENRCYTRFSCGYGDFKIENQGDILSLIDAKKMLGINLSKTYLMTPQKTITAVMGIKNN